MAATSTGTAAAVEPAAGSGAPAATGLAGSDLARVRVVAPQAITGSQFDPGNIISDALFYDRNAMTAAEIQAFLNAKIGSCLNSSCLNILRVTTFTRPADRTVCAQYTGAANELVSTILFKVQQACGISAKALLVTLQKEQGLITDRTPSATQLRIAMGYGCPDTAPCDSQFYGLYNQLYKAAWQLKRYSTPDRWGTFQPGVRSIGYHPNAACGAKTVTIRNNATAALYNYTPYTPNAAALANLGGTGNSCSSYGNRNFWYYYTSWFGATTLEQGQTVIAAHYTAQGGATGYLGAAGASTCTSTSNACEQEFAGGRIYWGRFAGAWAVRADFVPAYTAAGGPAGRLGYPTSLHIEVTGNPNGDGSGQQFQTGTIYSSAAGTFAVSGTIRDEYWRLGRNVGAPGWPTSDMICAAGDCGQQFQGAAVYSSTGLGLRSITGEALEVFRTDPEAFGNPLSMPTAVASSPNGGGTAQAFARGTIYSGPTVTAGVTGVLRTEYLRLGGPTGLLGWPTAAPTCSGGLCSQTFQLGRIDQRSATTALGSLSTYAATVTAHVSTLGAATTGYTVAQPNANGAGGAQGFERGTIYSSAAGVFPVSGTLRAEYQRLGANRGWLGWPTADPICSAGLCYQDFQHGTLVQTSSTVVRSLTEELRTIQQTWATELGLPTTAYGAARANANGPGGAQGFQRGLIYTSAAGSFANFGAVRTEYLRRGGHAGWLGWPTADPVCASGLCSQQFQFGTLTQTGPTTVTAAFAVHPAFESIHATFASQLGSPTSSYTTARPNPNGAGGAQAFASGLIYTSAAGSFPVFGAVRTEYLRRGGHAGALGWPTGDPVCGPSTCTQTFQRGSITK